MMLIEPVGKGTDGASNDLLNKKTFWMFRQATA